MKNSDKNDELNVLTAIFIYWCDHQSTPIAINMPSWDNFKNSLIYLVNGEIKIKEKEHKKIEDSTLILLSKGEKLKVKSISNSKFLLISGKPINEKIARGGPFVMNTKAEILQAVQDYHNGTFVK